MIGAGLPCSICRRNIAIATDGEPYNARSSPKVCSFPNLTIITRQISLLRLRSRVGPQDQLTEESRHYDGVERARDPEARHLPHGVATSLPFLT